MKTKSFDCVEMKRQGALRIHEITKDMTFDQKVAYWGERSRQFHEKQQRLIEKSSRNDAERKMENEG
jgi:hypothetical protein